MGGETETAPEGAAGLLAMGVWPKFSDVLSEVSRVRLFRRVKHPKMPELAVRINDARRVPTIVRMPRHSF